jgi:hypothetical protein
MSDQAIDFNRSLFAKTASGHQEIQTRALKLGQIPRRLLILIDGKRSTQELATLVADNDLNELLTELLDKGCIVAASTMPASAPPPVLPNDAGADQISSDRFLAKLPDAATRSSKDVEMARNVMTNTINNVFPLNFQVNLLEAIFVCNTTADVRRVYPQWETIMASSKAGIKRLPEFKAMLFKVL